MKDLRTWCRLLVAAALCFGIGTGRAARADDAACFPECRSGYVCHQGRCISRCNPPCDASETCTDAGSCVARKPAPGAIAAPRESAPEQAVSSGQGTSPAEAPARPSMRESTALRFALGAQVGGDMLSGFGRWVGGHVVVVKPHRPGWFLRGEVVWGSFTPRIVRPTIHSGTNAHEYEHMVIGVRPLVVQWLTDVLSVRYGGTVGYSFNYVFTPYCSGRSDGSLAVGPSAALGFHGWRPVGGGDWEFSLQADWVSMARPRCNADSSPSYYHTRWDGSLVLTAQSIYYF
jgi:hypothetical protein